MKTTGMILSTVVVSVLSCVQVTVDHEPFGWLALTGDAIDANNMALGRDNRSGGSVVLSLSVAAANYHANNNRGYNWSIKQLLSIQELTSLNATSGRFQLLAETTPPMSRKLIIGSNISSGKYKAELFIYYNKNKIGDADSLLSRYQLVFSLDN